MVMRRRPMLRGAAIGGGAYAAGKRAAQRAAGRAEQDDEQNERLLSLEQQRAQGTASGAATSMLDQLNELTALHQRGALTDSEFSAAKAKLLST
jgi:hypothetical protein